jgi:ribonuclease BN (tRNA processing enzyme)
VLGYSADSSPGWSLDSLGRDLDVALCEATFLHDRESKDQNHMSGRQAGDQAKRAEAKRLVVTHAWPTVDPIAIAAEAAAAFGGPVEMAVVGLTVVL